jgi:excisionase family DNA binding protein
MTTKVKTTKNKDWLKAEQVAERLSCSRSLVYSLIKAGAINTIRVGRNMFVTTQEVDKFIMNGGCTWE